jgi:hypothetical protein
MEGKDQLQLEPTHKRFSIENHVLEPFLIALLPRVMLTELLSGRGYELFGENSFIPFLPRACSHL